MREISNRIHRSITLFQINRKRYSPMSCQSIWYIVLISNPFAAYSQSSIRKKANELIVTIRHSRSYYDISPSLKSDDSPKDLNVDNFRLSLRGTQRESSQQLNRANHPKIYARDMLATQLECVNSARYISLIHLSDWHITTLSKSYNPCFITH